MKNKKFPAALWLADPNGDFEHDGVVGTASFDTKRGVDLDIPLGSISSDDSLSVVFDGSRAFDRLYGMGQNNDFITLVDAFGSTGASFPGFPYESWHAQGAIVSKGQFFATDPVVEHASVAIDGLFEWSRLNPVTGLSRFEGNKWSSTEISASANDLDDVIIYEDGSFSACLSPVVTIGGGQLPLKTQSITSDCHLTFNFADGSLPLSEAVDSFIVPFRDFLSLLMGFRAEISSVSLTSPDVKGQVRIYVPFVEASPDSLPKHALQRMPFAYPRVKDKMRGMAERWFSLPDDARRAADILLGVLANEHGVYLDSKFLAAASAFEALSRVNHKTEELSQKEFNRRLAAVKDGVSESKPRKWALRHLRYANFVPAGTLADKMLSELEPYSSFVVPDLAKFKRDHRAARNAYVHQTDDLGTEAVPKGQELYVHTEAVLFLVYGKLLNMLGITQQELIEGMRSSSFHWSDLHRAQEMYKLEQGDKLATAGRSGEVESPGPVGR